MNFTPPYVLLDEYAIRVRLGKLIGETVCVAWVSNIEKLRKTFDHTQISVQGKLEGDSNTGRYRVVVDDNNYTYFFPDSVWSLSQNKKPRNVKSGWNEDREVRPIIFIDHTLHVEESKRITLKRLTKDKDLDYVHF